MEGHVQLPLAEITVPPPWFQPGVGVIQPPEISQPGIL